MEVNKEEAARCRDLGAAALKSNNHARAIKMFNKSLHLYPLPGVKALLGQAERRKLAESENSNANTSSSATGQQRQPSNGNNSTHSSSARSTTTGQTTSRSSSTNSLPNNSTHSTGADGRQYTPTQLSIVTQVLKAKSSGGRSVHYKVLCIERNADDAAIKKAYRKLALKLHPDKNSAPKADEAFKAVGLAYATLSDTQKRRIYDVSGEEDPDNRGGGGGMRRGGGGANMHFHGQDVSPEDIFNMFFGGGMQGGGMAGMGGPGFRVYSSGFGPGFGAGNMRQQQQQQQRRRQQQNQQPDHPLGQLLQFLPLLLIMALSFFNMPGDGSNGMGGATGGNRYFSLTPVKPHINPLSTKLSKVKDIPYYVSDSFLRTVARDRYQLSQVERMVERSYSTYLIDECKNQKAYKRKLEILSTKKSINNVERTNLVKKANGFVLSRCMELEDLFPESVKLKDRVDRSQQHTEF